MNRLEASKLAGFRSSAFGLLTIVLLVTLSAEAKGHKPNKTGNQTRVVAHISFNGLSAVDMAMQKQLTDKRYLYVQHSKDEGISVVDVSQPAKAKVVGVIPWPDQGVSSRMNVTGDLAMVTESATGSTRQGTSGDDLVVWDLSQPSAPRVVQKFSGVVRFLEDTDNSIYVLNGEGLWVISPPEPQPQPFDPAIYYGS